MGIEGEPPTTEQVAYIRNKISNYLDDNGQGYFLLHHHLHSGQAFNLPTVNVRNPD